MKKTIRTILCVAAFAVLAVSCQKEMEINEVEPEVNTKETIDICVNGLMGEYTQVDGTKAELVNTVRVSWKGGETVYVYDGTQCLGTLKASREGTEDRYALLSTDDNAHTVSTPASGTTTLTLVYSPLLTEAPAVNDGAISISLASQSGAKAPFVAFATLDYTGTTITNAVVPFKFATSVIKVNCTGLKAKTAITSATLSNVSTVCKLTLSGAAAPSVSGVTNGTISRTGDAYFAADKVNEEGVAVFQIAAPKLGEASEARVLTIAQGSDEFEYKNFSKKALSAATSVNTVCQFKGLPAGALPGVFSVSATKKVYFSKGNLWADGSNVLHFEDAQWSSTPASDGSKDANHVSHFNWSDNVAAAVGNSNSGSNLFCDENNKQSVDGSDKIYYALSTAEWQYLFNYGDYTSKIRENKCRWATVNGVGGYVIAPDDFTGTLQESYANDAGLADAGNLVFLPAAGSRSGSDVSDVSDVGFYWSSTASKDGAYGVIFDYGRFAPDISVRCYGGYSVRLITESN